MACSAIVTTVSRHQAKVTVHKGGHAVNADSSFGLLSLAATRGTELILSATGPDAQEALDAVVRLLAEGPELAHCACFRSDMCLESGPVPASRLTVSPLQ